MEKPTFAALYRSPVFLAGYQVGPDNRFGDRFPPGCPEVDRAAAPLSSSVDGIDRGRFEEKKPDAIFSARKRSDNNVPGMIPKQTLRS